MLIKCKKFIFIIITVLIYSCGTASFEVQNKSYEPRIVIEGFLVANQGEQKIYISRNFKLDANLNTMNLLPDPDDTEVSITDLQTNNMHHLQFRNDENDGDNDAYWTFREGDDMAVLPGYSYRLQVNTCIEGRDLYAASTTKVPQAGFDLIGQNFQELAYRQKNEHGQVMNFELQIARSPASNFYVAEYQAVNPLLENFIFDNPFQEMKPEDVNIVNHSYNYEVMHHTAEDQGQSVMQLHWWGIRFYGLYKAVVFVADDNYKDYLITYNDVMEMDGNFHEARFNIEGDGIGIFGSMIADTTYFEVLR